MKNIIHALVPVLFLLYAPAEVRAAKQKRFGIELCKRHCVRYNRCYGIRYNITSITCTILNDRNTDGEDVDLSRKDILQRFQAAAICSSSQFYSRVCIINKKGRTIHFEESCEKEHMKILLDMSETTESLEEELQHAVASNMSSLQNLVCAKGMFSTPTCYIPEAHYSKADVFAGVINKEFLPGRRYMIQILFRAKLDGKFSNVKVLTLSVFNTSNFDLRRMTRNITYAFSNSNGMACYYGRRGDVTKAKFDIYSGNILLLFDRASSGSFLHDMDFTGNVRGSIELPNLKEAMFIAVQLYLPLNATFDAPLANKHLTFDEGLKKWYTLHYNGTSI